MSRPVKYRQLHETMMARIEQRILEGVWPPGSRLIEQDLAATYGVSRGSVREVLRELGRESLVAENPRGGATVGIMTQADLRKVYEVREGIEAIAIRVLK